MSEKTEYVPYGTEWKKEVSKLQKSIIIDMLSKKGNECNHHIDERAEAIGRVIEQKEKVEVLEERNKKLLEACARAYILIEKKVTDDLGVRIDLGTVFNKSQVLKEIGELVESK